ncbi:hypothetical protein E8E13_002186 [Curvularia kusanoi]|uniref:AB hydrolase-1 domain-containing protein n=1 Tax=Curvularia kusanoi TaxID=90978 RepID=A0A9P4T8G9_CURKU|nr:hypothetical protein E8E13_002186 [Curvularia kusanoi]
MIGTSIPQYIFIRLCIFALRLITPLSIFYVSFSLAEHPTSAGGRFLLTWSVIEAAFWPLVYIPRKRALQAAAQHPPLLEKEERKALFWKIWDYIPHPEYYISRWFLGARPGEVRRDNVKEFFEWALLNRGTETEDELVRRAQEDPEAKIEEEAELKEYVDGIETMLGRPLLPGRGPAKSLRLTIDEVNMRHRPVVWYLIVMLVDTLTAAYLRYNGFLLHRTPLRSSLAIFPPRPATLLSRHLSAAPNLSYWYRPHTSKTRLPILFIHGIGIGLMPYSKWLSSINTSDPLSPTDGSIGILAIELLPISFRLTAPLPSPESLVLQINSILIHHGFTKVVLASHSYGTVLSTHLLKSPLTGPKIGPCLLIDPIPFLLHLPDVAYNFTARRPQHANEHQLWYFASTDMMVAHTLARGFFWAANVLWKEDLRGRKVTCDEALSELPDIT